MTAFAMLAQASRLVLLQGMTGPGGTQGIGLCRDTNLCVTNTPSQFRPPPRSASSTGGYSGQSVLHNLIHVDLMS